MITNLLYVIVMIHVSKRAREEPGADFLISQIGFQTASDLALYFLIFLLLSKPVIGILFSTRDRRFRNDGLSPFLGGRQLICWRFMFTYCSY